MCCSLSCLFHPSPAHPRTIFVGFVLSVRRVSLVGAAAAAISGTESEGKRTPLALVVIVQLGY